MSNAEAAGATGIVIGNNAADAAGRLRPATATIYGVMVSQADGDRVQERRPAPVNVTITADDIRPARRLLRWLMGEKSDRLRWRHPRHVDPTCYGDPGKVSDAEY